LDKNQNDLTAHMANAAYKISYIIAIALVWIWLAILILGMARNAPVTFSDVLIGGSMTFALAFAIYFAGWGWRRYWTGKTDHFFSRN
jgi:hypothetical protein